MMGGIGTDTGRAGCRWVVISRKYQLNVKNTHIGHEQVGMERTKANSHVLSQTVPVSSKSVNSCGAPCSLYLDSIFIILILIV